MINNPKPIETKAERERTKDSSAAIIFFLALATVAALGCAVYEHMAYNQLKSKEVTASADDLNGQNPANTYGMTSGGTGMTPVPATIAPAAGTTSGSGGEPSQTSGSPASGGQIPASGGASGLNGSEQVPQASGQGASNSGNTGNQGQSQPQNGNGANMQPGSAPQSGSR